MNARQAVLIIRRGMPAAPKARYSQRLAALLTVRQVLGDEHIVITHKPSGAPILLGSELNISVSHDRHILALTLSRDGGIGVDLQFARPVLKKAIQRSLSPEEEGITYPAEHPAVAGLSSALALWTAKEAVVKASGHEGIVMTDITVSPDFATATAFGRSYALHFALIDEDEEPAEGADRAALCLAFSC